MNDVTDSVITVHIRLDDFNTIRNLFMQKYITFEQLPNESLGQFIQNHKNAFVLLFNVVKLTPERLFRCLESVRLCEKNTKVRLSRSQISGIIDAVRTLDPADQPATLEKIIGSFIDLVFLPTAPHLISLYKQDYIRPIVKRQLIENKTRLGFNSVFDIVLKLFKNQLVDETINPATYVLSCDDVNEILTHDECVKIFTHRKDYKWNKDSFPNGNLKDVWWSVQLMRI